MFSRTARIISKLHFGSNLEHRVTVLETQATQTSEALKNILERLGSLKESTMSEFAALRAENRNEFNVLRAENRNEFNVLRAEMDGRFRNIMISMSNLSAGLGKGLEQLSARWLERILLDQGVQNLDIETNVEIDDPQKIINPMNTRFEVDVLSIENSVVVECTTSLRSSELKKLLKFIEIKKFLERKYGVPFKAYFVTYQIDPRIRSEAYEIFNEHGIICIDATNEIP